jgi:hypothetical protein
VREFLNANTLANDARMRRTSFAGAFIYLEGECDERLYSLFFDSTACQFIIAHTKINVLGVCRLFATAPFAGVIGIVDSDFDFLDNSEQVDKNLFSTDLHDAECMMLSGSAFDRLMSEFASPAKLLAWKKVNTAEVRDFILEQAMQIGALLWYSNREGLGLTFRSLEYKEFIDPDSLVLDRDKFIGHLKNKSSRHDIKDEALKEALIDRLSKGRVSPWHLACGHHFVSILGIGFRWAFGNRPPTEVTVTRLEQSLRLSYPINEFSKTKLFRYLKEWEKTNAGYKLLRDDIE